MISFFSQFHPGEWLFHSDEGLFHPGEGAVVEHDAGLSAIDLADCDVGARKAFVVGTGHAFSSVSMAADESSTGIAGRTFR